MYSPQKGKIRHIARALEISPRTEIPAKILASKLNIEPQLLEFLLAVVPNLLTISIIDVWWTL